MRKIIAGLDLGTSFIKLVVGEIVKDKVNVLSCVSVPARGFKKGFVINPDGAVASLKELFSKTEDFLGMPVKKVIVNVPSSELSCFITSGSTTITNEEKIISNDDLTRALQASVYNKIEDNQELLSLLPTKFVINEDENVKDPIGCVANKLSVSSVAVIVPKVNVDGIRRVLSEINITVSDISCGPLADYYEFKNDDMNKKNVAIVNIGYSKTEVSIFKKGVLTSCDVIDIGSSNIDSDIAYLYKISKKDAYFLREQMAVCDIHLASVSEAKVVKDINGEDKKITQYDVSSVVISRLSEILGLVKKQINLLTKKEISYIILSGGISETKHFNHLINDVLSNDAYVGETFEIGARNNKFSSCLGIIKYYNSRLKMKNKYYSIFDEDEEEDFGGKTKKINISDDSLLGKIYGYFFDN